MTPLTRCAIGSPWQSLLRGARLAAACAALAFGASLSKPGRLAATEWFVDSQNGADQAGNGSASAPVRTVAFALAESRGEDVTVRLAPGLYRGAEPICDELESFPLAAPDGAVRLAIIGPPAAEGEAVIESADSALSIGLFTQMAAGGEVPPEGRLRELHFSGVRFRGGASGITVVLPPIEGAPEPFTVSFEACRFEGTAGNAVVVSAGSGWDARVEVSGCRFEGCAGGLAVEALESARLDLTVEGSAFAEMPALVPGAILGGAVDLHADGGAEIVASCERNLVRNSAVGFVVTSSEPEPKSTRPPARLDVRIAGNVVYSDPSVPCTLDGVASACGVLALLHLAHWPKHSLDLRVVNNTVWGVERFGVYIDNLDRLEASPPLELPIVFANNVVWSEGARLETDGTRFSNAGDGVLSGLLLEHNIVPVAWRGVVSGDTSWSEDPLFSAPLAGGFELVEGSPAIDRGASSWAGRSALEELGDHDIDGRCRFASSGGAAAGALPPVDLGAYEAPGLCRGEEGVFRRGDCNGDGSSDISDVFAVLSYLFLSGARVDCADACDTDDNGRIEITDGIYLLNFLFLGFSAPPAPFLELGSDPTDDALSACQRAPRQEGR